MHSQAYEWRRAEARLWKRLSKFPNDNWFTITTTLLIQAYNANSKTEQTVPKMSTIFHVKIDIF